MISVDVQKPLGMMLFNSCFPKNDFNSGEQKHNAEGLPLWSVSVLLRQPDARRVEQITITVPSQTDPSTALEPFTPVAFSNLRIMTGENNGKIWVSFAADQIGKPSNK